MTEPIVVAIISILGSVAATLTALGIRRATSDAKAAQDKTASIAEGFAEFKGALSQSMSAMTAQIGRVDEVLLRIEGKISDGGEAVMDLSLKVRELDTRLEALEER